VSLVMLCTPLIPYSYAVDLIGDAMAVAMFAVVLKVSSYTSSVIANIVSYSLLILMADTYRSCSDSSFRPLAHRSYPSFCSYASLLRIPHIALAHPSDRSHASVPFVLSYIHRSLLVAPYSSHPTHHLRFIVCYLSLLVASYSSPLFIASYSYSSPRIHCLPLIAFYS
jgi:hypothetical protein